MAKKKKHHKSGRETSHLLSANPSADTLFEVMLGPLYRWHNRGHRDYEVHIEELLKGFRLAPEVRRVYDAAAIKACADAFRNGHFKKEKDVTPLEVPVEKKAFDPYDVCTAMDVEIQLELTALVDRRLAETKLGTVTMGDARTIAEKIERRILRHHPDLTSVFTGELLLARVVNVANAYSLFERMLAAAGEIGKDGYEIMPGVVQDFWEAKEGAGKEMAKDCPPDVWRAGVTKAIEYILRESAVDIAKRKKTADAAEVELKLYAALRKLDTRGDITPHIDRRFVAAVAAAVVAIRRLGGLADATKQAATPEAAPPLTADVTYRIPANYWSWAVLRQFLATAVECKADNELFVSSGANFYLLGEQFLHELVDTDLLIDDLRIMDEAPLPHPAFLWLLPNKFMAMETKDGTLYGVGAMAVTLMSVGSGKGVGVDLFSYDPAKNYFPSVTLTYKFDDHGVLKAYASAGEKPNSPALSSGVLSLLLKVLTSMAAAPKIVECEATESVRPSKKGKRGLEFRTPRVIGWKIRYIRAGGSAKKLRLAKGHVEPHWRRRHIKRVPYGPMSVPLEERPRRIAVIERTRVNSEYEKTK
jgi:hypothetical protein